MVSSRDRKIVSVETVPRAGRARREELSPGHRRLRFSFQFNDVKDRTGPKDRPADALGGGGRRLSMEPPDPCQPALSSFCSRPDISPQGRSSEPKTNPSQTTEGPLRAILGVRLNESAETAVYAPESRRCQEEPKPFPTASSPRRMSKTGAKPKGSSPYPTGSFELFSEAGAPLEATFRHRKSPDHEGPPERSIRTPDETAGAEGCGPTFRSFKRGRSPFPTASSPRRGLDIAHPRRRKRPPLRPFVLCAAVPSWPADSPQPAAI